MSSEGEAGWAALPGRLVVISGPSGSGKSTLVRHLLDRPDLRLRVSVSATTRRARPGEADGRDYFFVAPETFEQMRPGLLEFAQVHDHLYGTPAEPVRQAMAQGYCVLLVIDVQGGLQVRAKVPHALMVFIQVPNLEILQRRLRRRGSDSDAAIEQRIANAKWEIEMAIHYDVQVINDDLDRAVEELASILVAHGCGGRKNDD
jgi:guanylate kinase